MKNAKAMGGLNMVEVQGYTITEEVSESTRSVIYRGYMNADSKSEPVILKVIKQEYKELDLQQLKSKYDTLTQIQSPGIVKTYGAVDSNQGLVLILEDFKAEPLYTYVHHKPLDIKIFFDMAIQLADALDDIHKWDMIHNTITPHNILFQEETGKVKLCDFYMATFFTKDHTLIYDIQEIEDTLPYISPEQTGRINSFVDYRTDFYSLGITFYEMLTGKPPFRSEDPMELVHSHIARKPLPVDKVNDQVPSMLSDILMKLLMKNGEDRYQSGYGLKADLEECRIQFIKTGKVQEFTLGKKDISYEFLIPSKLYGREREMTELRSAYKKITEGQGKMVLVSGHAGIGKTTLVQEFQRTITEQKPYFVYGKFEPYKKNIPYSGVIQAFRGLIMQMLTEEEEEVARWRHTLLSALGADGQVIVEVIPEIELIIGKQPDASYMDLSESQYRFIGVFQKLIEVFKDRQQPFILFLDDLQYADVESVYLIRDLMGDGNNRFFMLIGSFRDEEVKTGHLFLNIIQDIKEKNIEIVHISLAPLGKESVSQLVSAVINVEPEKLEILNRLICQKTGNNPFFIKQFLKSLYKENILVFDSHEGWQWDMAKINGLEVTDNVVGLMADKISRLSSDIQKIMKLASCIGMEFDMDTLAVLYEKSEEDTFLDLFEAIREDLVSVSDRGCKFLHSRVQEAAYSLIEEEEKKETHYKIGRLLSEKMQQKGLSYRIFEIADHYNYGVDLLQDEAERKHLIYINVIAGQKKKAQGEYQSAIGYFTYGMRLLSLDSWQDEYDLTVTLYMECGESQYLIGNFEQTEKLFFVILERIKDGNQKNRVYKMAISLYTYINKVDQAIWMGRKALRMLEMHLPSDLSGIERSVEQERELVESRMQSLTDEELRTLPCMSNEQHRDGIELMVNLCAPAYMSQINTFKMIVYKMMHMTLVYGQSAYTSYIFAAYAMLLMQEDAGWDRGIALGELALTVGEAEEDLSIRCKLYYIYGAGISHWKNHLKTSQRYLETGIKYGLHHADRIYYDHCVHHHLLCMFYKGDNIEDIQDIIKKQLQDCKEQQNTVFWDLLVLRRQVIRNLKGLTENKFSFNDEDFSMDRVPSAANQTVLAHYYCSKMQVCYLYENYSEAFRMAVRCEKSLQGVMGSLMIPEFSFYYSLILASLYPIAESEEQKQYMELIKKHSQRVEKWAKGCKENYEHKHFLLQAEIARITDRGLDAMTLYDEAIRGAKEYKFTQNRSIANELAGKFYLAKGNGFVAKAYITEARVGYQKWGAVSKVEDIDEKYAALFFKQNVSKYREVGGEAGLEVLDLATVMKATQAISSEIILHKLLDSLMDILIENAGAQKGFFILNREGKLYIEAKRDVDSEQVTLIQSNPVDKSQMLSPAIINYVRRTGESIVMSDAVNEGIFRTDPYVVKHQVRSILCTPIIKQSKLIGIVYLENNLSANAFTAERLDILKLLTTQIAISLENAMLYEEMKKVNMDLQQEIIEKRRAEEEIRKLNEELEQRVIIRTAELQKTLDTLKKTQVELVQSEKMAALGGLVAGVAHEINTPVGVGVTAASHLDKKTKDFIELYKIGSVKRSDLEKYIQVSGEATKMILSNLERASELIQSFKKVAVDQTSEEKRPFYIKEYIGEVLLSLRPKIKKTKHQINIVCEQDIEIDSYPGAFSQVVTNLVMNSLIHAYEEEDEGNILFELSQKNDTIFLRYSDDGKGIDKDAIKKIFDPFFTTKRGSGGSGLGLHIIFNIVTQKLGGTIKCESEIGVGTVFYISFPILSTKECSGEEKGYDA